MSICWQARSKGANRSTRRSVGCVAKRESFCVAMAVREPSTWLAWGLPSAPRDPGSVQCVPMAGDTSTSHYYIMPLLLTRRTYVCCTWQHGCGLRGTYIVSELLYNTIARPSSACEHTNLERTEQALDTQRLK